MPAAWSKNDEKQYEAILNSCLDRDSRKTQVCKRIAGATVNKRRAKEGRTLGEVHFEAKAIPGHPDTGGWEPGWKKACGSFDTRAKAQKYIDRYGREGAKYRIKKGAGPACPRSTAWVQWLALGAATGVAVAIARRSK